MKHLLAIIISLSVITACGNSQKAATRESVLTSTATFTSIGSSTSSSTTTPTSSHTPITISTPEVLQFEVTMLEQIATMDYESDFTRVSTVTFEQLSQAPPRQEIKYTDETLPVTAVFQEGKQVAINATFNRNFFFQQAVQVEQNGHTYNVFMFKAVVQSEDRHNSLVSLNISLEPVPGENNDFIVTQFRNVTLKPGVSLFILTADESLYNFDPSFLGPLIGPNAAREKLLTNNIDVDIGSALLWVRFSTTYYPPNP